jgi:hypothetical protein
VKERLMGFVFVGALAAVAVNLAADRIHAWLFSDSLWFQAHWYIPYLIVPAACLLALAFSFGFFRSKTRAGPMPWRFWPRCCCFISRWAPSMPAGNIAFRPL